MSGLLITALVLIAGGSLGAVLLAVDQFRSTENLKGEINRTKDSIIIGLKNENQILKDTITKQNVEIQEKQDSIQKLNKENRKVISDLSKITASVETNSLYIKNLLFNQENTLVISECNIGFTLVALNGETQENIKSLVEQGKSHNYTFEVYQEVDGKAITKATIDIKGTWEGIFRDNTSIYKANSFVYDMADIKLKIFDANIYVTSGIGVFSKTLPLKLEPKKMTLVGQKFDWSKGEFILSRKGKKEQAELKKTKDGGFIGTFKISDL